MEVTIGVISDTHYGPGDPVPFLIKKQFEGVDRILHAGDINFPHVITELSETAPVYAVCGNTDPADLDLPVVRDLNINGVKLILTHGYGTPLGLEERLDRKFDDGDLVVYGHTHVAAFREREGRWFLNPGSPVRPKPRGRPPTVAVLTIGEDGGIRNRFIEL